MFPECHKDPASLAESTVFVALSYIVFGWWAHLRPYDTVAESVMASIHMVVPLLYLPCLIMVLRRPNEGDVPEWLERKVSGAVRPVRRRLRGLALHKRGR